MATEGRLTIEVVATRREDGGVDLVLTDSDDPHERRLTGLPFSDVWAMGPLAGELCGQRITELLKDVRGDRSMELEHRPRAGFGTAKKPASKPKKKAKKKASTKRRRKKT